MVSVRRRGQPSPARCRARRRHDADRGKHTARHPARQSGETFEGFEHWRAWLTPVIDAAIAFGLNRSDLMSAVERAYASSDRKDPLTAVVDELASALPAERPWRLS